jgi:hypothetical protein
MTCSSGGTNTVTATTLEKKCKRKLCEKKHRIIQVAEEHGPKYWQNVPLKFFEKAFVKLLTKSAKIFVNWSHLKSENFQVETTEILTCNTLLSKLC